jgi:serine/threonine protein kinase
MTQITVAMASHLTISMLEALIKIKLGSHTVLELGRATTRDVAKPKNSRNTRNIYDNIYNMAIGSQRQSGAYEEYLEAEEVPFSYQKLIGFGAVGVVYKVKGVNRPFQNQIFAQKVIALDEKNESIREEQLAEIGKEVEMLRNTQHHHVVRLVQSYLYDNNFAIVMDPLADGNLKDYLESANASLDSPAGNNSLSQWFGCLINSVAYLHGKGIRHRDIKPENILVKGENILLTDFGISMMGLGITVPTTIVNRPRARTVEYCAPEVEVGRTRGRAADIFSLGAVILEMLTAYSYPNRLDEFKNRLEYEKGKISFAKKLDELARWITSMDAAPVKEGWHSAILFVCKGMLRTDRDLRPKADDVRSWLSFQEPSTKPPMNCDCSQLLENLYTVGNATEKLLKAYKNGHRLMRDFLLDQGATLEDSDTFVAACEGGLRDSVESSLRKGVDVNSGGALQKASAGGFTAIVRILLEEGADTERKDEEGLTAIERAVIGGHKGVVELLTGWPLEQSNVL